MSVTRWHLASGFHHHVLGVGDHLCGSAGCKGYCLESLLFFIAWRMRAWWFQILWNIRVPFKRGFNLTFFLVNLAIGCWLQRLKQPFFSPDSFHHRHGFFSRRWRWDVIHSWKTATVSYRHGHPGVLLKTVIQCRFWCPVMVIPYSLGRLLQPAMSVGFLGLSCWWVHLT